MAIMGSLPARGVWIETAQGEGEIVTCIVTPRKGSVD